MYINQHFSIVKGWKASILQAIDLNQRKFLIKSIHPLQLQTNAQNQWHEFKLDKKIPIKKGEYFAIGSSEDNTNLSYKKVSNISSFCIYNTEFNLNDTISFNESSYCVYFYFTVEEELEIGIKLTIVN